MRWIKRVLWAVLVALWAIMRLVLYGLRMAVWIILTMLRKPVQMMCGLMVTGGGLITVFYDTILFKLQPEDREIIYY